MIACEVLDRSAATAAQMTRYILPGSKQQSLVSASDSSRTSRVKVLFHIIIAALHLVPSFRSAMSPTALHCLGMEAGDE